MCSCFTGTRENAESTIPARLLKVDLQILRQTLEEAHPGLYWYTSKKEMDSYLDSLEASIDNPMEKLEFMKLLMPAIAKVRCGHTNLRFAEDISPDMLAKSRLFPLGVIVINRKLYIRENPVDPAQTGFEIKSINNIATNEIINRIVDIIPADGFSSSFKYHLLSTAVFQEGYALLYGEPDEFIVDAAGTDGNSVQLKLKSIPANDFIRGRRVENAGIDLKFEKDNTAIITIRTFVISRSAFNSEIASVFEKIRNNNSTQLIVDVRNNGGGNNVNVTELFSYLSDKPFYHLRKTEVTGKTLTHSRHITNYEEIANARSTLSADGTYEVDDQYPGRTLREPASNAFNGKLIVLANGGTNSAASEFVALVHGNKRGLIVGEETGGCYYGATGGRYLSLVLPNSTLRATIPMVRIYTAVPEDFKNQPKGRGTFPDHEVLLTREDLRSTADKMLEFALGLLRK